MKKTQTNNKENKMRRYKKTQTNNKERKGEILNTNEDKKDSHK